MAESAGVVSVDEEKGLFAGYGGNLLVGLAITWVTFVTARLLLPPLLPVIISDFGIGLSTAGIMLTVLQICSAAVLYPSGRFSDQLSRATLIVPGLTVFVIGALLIAGAPVYLALLIGAAALGVGNGMFTISARALISDHFVERRGQALGIFTTGFNAGGLLASVVAAIIVVQWRIWFVGIAVVVATATVVFLYWNREPYVLTVPDIALGSTVRRLWATRGLREPVIAYALFFFVTQGFLGFFPTYLQEAKGFSPVLASVGFALVFLVGTVSKISAGTLSDRFSRQHISIAGMGLLIVGLAGIVLTEATWAVLLMTAVFAIGHQSQFPLIDAILMDIAPVSNVGGDLGASKTVLRLVGSIGPTYVGFAAAQYGLNAAFAGLVAVLVVSTGYFVYGVRNT